MTTAEQSKLNTLMDVEGFDGLEHLLEAALFDSASPAICMNEGCNYTEEMEGDQTAGWCDACNTNSMKSALVLAGVL